MGAEPDYTFRFVVARRDGERWVPVPVEQPEWPWEASRRLSAMWTRIWSEPVRGP
jgi:inner membrane protein